MIRLVFPAILVLFAVEIFATLFGFRNLLRIVLSRLIVLLLWIYQNCFLRNDSCNSITTRLKEISRDQPMPGSFPARLPPDGSTQCIQLVDYAFPG